MSKPTADTETGTRICKAFWAEAMVACLGLSPSAMRSHQKFPNQDVTYTEQKKVCGEIKLKGQMCFPNVATNNPTCFSRILQSFHQEMRSERPPLEPRPVEAAGNQ